MKQTARSGDFHHLIRRKSTLVDTGLEDISELNDTFLSLKLSSEGVLGKDFEEKLKSRSETNKQIKDLLPELNRKPSSTTGVKRKGTVKPQVQDAKVAKTDFSSFRIPKVENNVAKTNHDKSGYKSNFKRSGTGRQNFDKDRIIPFVATTGLNDCRNRVNILCQNQEILVGGRLGHFWQNWGKKPTTIGFYKGIKWENCLQIGLKSKQVIILCVGLF
jgi:hypothetical protein